MYKYCKLGTKDEGFSLIQGMILGAVMAGAGLITTKLITNQKMTQKSAETRSNIDQLNDMVFSILQNRGHCTRTFLSNSLDTSMTGQKTANGIWVDRLGAAPTENFAVHGTSFDQAKSYINGTVIIKDISVDYPLDLKDPATLSVTYLPLDGRDVNANTGTVKKNISVVIQRETSGTFAGCYAIAKESNYYDPANPKKAEAGTKDLLKDFCNSLNQSGSNNGNSFFSWDENNNFCRPKNHTCPPGQIFVGVDSNGAVICKHIHQWLDLTKIVDSTSAPCINSPEAKFTIVGNKVKLDCVDPSFVTCSAPNGGGPYAGVDKAGSWNQFGSGYYAAGANDYTDDWSINVSVDVPGSKRITRMRTSWAGWEKFDTDDNGAYPPSIYSGGALLNNAWGLNIGPYSGPTNFDLWFQGPPGVSFANRGMSIIVTLDDGTSGSCSF